MATEGLEVLYSFAGHTVDRSQFDFSFDGASIEIVLEDHARPNGRFRLIFDWVSYFSFESKEAMLKIPNYPSESLVELNISEFVKIREARHGPYLNDQSKQFVLFLLDVGDLCVVCRNAAVKIE